jgi:hypothetical protein
VKTVRIVTIPVAACVLALPATASAANGLTAAVSDDRAGAAPVALTLSLRAELKCGRLTGTSLTIRLPTEAHLPATVPGSAVLVGGKSAARVRVLGSSLAVALPLPRGIAICHSITSGVAKIVVTQAAGLGNPATPGTYRVALVRGRQTADAPLTIR